MHVLTTLTIRLRALLIQKSIKLPGFFNTVCNMFESFVNSEEYQTAVLLRFLSIMFESFVNSEEYQTVIATAVIGTAFESFVNSKVV